MEIYDETQPLDLDFPLRMKKMWIRKKQDELIRYHKHHYYEITCILNGHGFISVNGKRFALEAGDVVLFNVDEVHGWELEEDMRLFMMYFSSELIFDKVSLFDYEYLRFFEEKGSHFMNKISHQEIYAKRIYGAMEDIRIYKARELILTGRYNVLEVSQMCGYNNISNFYRAYKKIFGKTPKDNEPQQ